MYGARQDLLYIGACMPLSEVFNMERVPAPATQRIVYGACSHPSRHTAPAAPLVTPLLRCDAPVAAPAAVPQAKRDTACIDSS